MPIARYKLQSRRGISGKHIPDNILDGGYWGIGDYLFGWIEEDNEIKQLTNDEFKNIILSRHSETPYTELNSETGEEVELTVEQLNDRLNSWISTITNVNQ
jgi:hydrogenase maturation factor HypE